MSRAETEAQLETAAIALMKHDGILAGLNLREVADAAGVNRGLVYHYFGSRRELLTALRKDAAHRLEEIRSGATLPFAARWRRFLRIMIADREAVKLMTTLVLDGDTELRTMPLKTETRTLLEADLRAGTLAPDTDLEGTHAAIVSFVWGYLTYREVLAREFDMPADELDDRIGVVFDLMLRGLAPSRHS